MNDELENAIFDIPTTAFVFGGGSSQFELRI